MEVAEKDLGRDVARLSIEIARWQLAGLEHLLPISRFALERFRTFSERTSFIALLEELLALPVETTVETQR
jgi:hypothetical protein